MSGDEACCLMRSMAAIRTENAGKFRAFIAVEVPDCLGIRQAIAELAGFGAGLKCVSPSSIHVTLKFLGDTPVGLVPQILGSMCAAAAQCRPFRARLAGVGAFPGAGRISVVWAGIRDAGELGNMAQSLDSSLFELGFVPDGRPFSAHLTLARVRSVQNIAALREFLSHHASTELGEFSVDRIVLKKSVLSPLGPSYSTVAEAKLGEPRASKP